MSSKWAPMVTSIKCEGADFCQELSGDDDTSFTRVYEGEPESRTIFSSENFVLLADMSPLTVGHLLLLPKQHYLSFAQAAESHPDEVRYVVGRTRELYNSTFSKSLILEHGSASTEDHKACITHAHWHFLPINGDQMDFVFAREGLDYVDLDDLRGLSGHPWVSRSYYLRSYQENYRVYFPKREHRRQYLRSVAGQLLKIEDPEWDYALVVRKEQLRKTMEMVSDWRLE